MKNDASSLKLPGKKCLVEKEIMEMNSATRKLYDEMKPLLSAGVTERIKARWQLGRHVETAANDPGKYGRRSIQRLAECLGCGRDLLDDAKRWPWFGQPRSVSKACSARAI